MEALARAVLDTRIAGWMVGLVVVITGVAALVAGGVEQDDDVLAFLPATNPDVVTFYDINDRFGGLDVAIVGIEAPDLFSPEFLAPLSEATVALNELESIIYAVSIVNVDDVVPDPDLGGIRYGQLIETPPSDAAEAELIRDRVMSRDAVIGHLVSEAGDAVNLYCVLGAEADQRSAAGEVRAIIDAAFPEHRKYWGGAPFISNWIYDTTQADMDKLTPWAVIAIVLILMVTFRDLRGTLLALVATGMGIAVSHGLMAALGVRYNIVLSSMPVILFAVGSAYSIHILAHYYAHEPVVGSEEAIRRTMVGIGPTVLVAGLTTVAGLLSFLMMDIEPMRTFGLFTAIGIFATLVLSVTFVPAVIRLTGLRRKAGAWGESGPMIWLVGFSARHKIVVGVVLLILAGSSVGAVTQVHTRMDNAAFFNEGSEPDLSEAFLSEHFGGSQFVQLWVRGDLKDPEVLADLRYTGDVLEELDGVGASLHVASAMTEANRAMEGIYRLPDDRPKAATLFGLMTGNKAMEQLVDDDRTEALVQVKLSARHADEMGAVLEQVEAFMASRPDRIEPREQVAARLGGICRTLNLTCPPRAELRALLDQPLGLGDPGKGVTDRLVDFMGTDEFLVPLPQGDPTLPRRLAEAVTALGPEADGAGLTRVASQLLELSAEDAFVGDVVFSLETPVQEFWTLARTEIAAAELLGLARVAVPDDDRGRRLMAYVAGALSELDRVRPETAPAIRYQVSGLPVLYRGVERSVTANQWKALGFALALVVVLLSLVFRSLFTGLLATVPTALTLLLVYGAMGTMGVSLDIGTSMLASLIIGAGVDYAVHMVAGWRAPDGEPASAGAQVAARCTGVAIWTNATMVAAGFFVLTLGEARPLQNVGMLTASAMIIAAMTTFVAVPVLARKRSYRAASALDAMHTSVRCPADTEQEAGA